MVVLNKKWFKLPHVEKDKFVLLLRSGLSYSRESGNYSISNFNNIEKLSDILAGILNEKVSFTQTCLLCNKDFACPDCSYYEMCETKDLPLHCVCSKCLREGRTFNELMSE